MYDEEEEIYVQYMVTFDDNHNRKEIKLFYLILMKLNNLIRLVQHTHKVKNDFYL